MSGEKNADRIETTGVGAESADERVEPAGIGAESAGAEAESTGVGAQSTGVGTESTGVSRREVLRSGGVVAGGALLPALAGRGRATPHGGSDRPLDVRTTDVEVLDKDSTKTTGAVDGMDRVDCEECRVGAQVSPVGHDRWYGGMHGVVTARVSFRAAVTLVGLRPGKYRCRLVACPITHDHVCFGNALTIVVRGSRGKHDDHRGKDHHDGKHDNHGKHDHRDRKRDDCPCGRDHPGKHHLTLLGDDWKTVHDYAFMASSDGIEPFTWSSNPDAIDHEFVTANGSDRVHGDIVTGTVAGGADSYLLAGDLTDLRCDDGVSVFLDGRTLDY